MEIDGWEDRARDGYHVGYVPFGYLPPDYPKAPDGASSTWHPPRMPVRPHPVTFPALVHIGELSAQGSSDSAIADELDDYTSHTPRFGERRLSKDTIASIRWSWFPREFAPGCGHGTIETPSGELVEGKHQAAWPYDLWQRMVEVKASHYRRPAKEAQRRSYEFSRIIVCAACRRPLRATTRGATAYYRDSSAKRKLDCSASGGLSVRSSTVIYQFGDILRDVELPPEWREVIAERCRVEVVNDDSAERVRAQRLQLEGEQDRLMSLFVKGYITEKKLDEQMEPLRTELFALPVPMLQDADEVRQAAISAGETLTDMADYWAEATCEERRDMVWSLLTTQGLVYDLERGFIVGLLPRPTVLPVLALGLESTGRCKQCDGGLWMRPEYWPPKRDLNSPRLPPPQPPSLTPTQQDEAMALLHQGMSIRKVAKAFGTSYESIRRLMKKQGVVLPPQQTALTQDQRQEALALIQQGASVRQVAKALGVSYTSIQRLLKQEKVVPSYHQPALTPIQQEEVLTLVRQGVSLREVGKQFGVAHQTISRIVKRLERR